MFFDRATPFLLFRLPLCTQPAVYTDRYRLNKEFAGSTTEGCSNTFMIGYALTAGQVLHCTALRFLVYFLFPP